MTGTIKSNTEKVIILSQLPVKAILAHLKGVLSFSKAKWYSKELLVQSVVQDAPAEQLNSLLTPGQKKQCKRGDKESTCCITQRLEDAKVDEDDRDDYDLSNFLVVPSEE